MQGILDIVPMPAKAVEVKVVEMRAHTRNSEYRIVTLYVDGIPGTVSQMVCVSGTLMGETWSVHTDEVINVDVGESLQGHSITHGGSEFWTTPVQGIWYYTYDHVTLGRPH